MAVTNHLIAVSNNVELTIRVCSLESMDNSCGMFRYQNEYMQVSSIRINIVESFRIGCKHDGSVNGGIFTVEYSNAAPPISFTSVLSHRMDQIGCFELLSSIDGLFVQRYLQCIDRVSAYAIACGIRYWEFRSIYINTNVIALFELSFVWIKYV